MREGVCLGYIMGVIDMSKSSQVEPHLQYGASSTPYGATAGQLKSIVVKYLNEHPELRHYVAQDLVYLAIKLAFKDQ